MPASLEASPQAEVAAGADAITLALRRGTAFLQDRQAADGSYRASVRSDSYPVALTAISLWAVARADFEPSDPERASRAGRFLARHAQADGGIYDPDRGLSAFTSGIAGRALDSLRDGSADPTLERVALAAELFAYRRAWSESWVDAVEVAATPPDWGRERAKELLRRSGELSASQVAALEFVRAAGGEVEHRLPRRMRTPMWKTQGASSEELTYGDLLQLSHARLRPEHPLARRALRAVRSYYTLDRNPDLSKRFGEQGFREQQRGLYFYFFVLARTLSAHAVDRLTTPDGIEHDWARELARRLLDLQRPDGSWGNSDGSWWEDEPVLVTAYALWTLRACQDELSRRLGASSGD